ncbi:MAG: multidrug efflux transporter permease subunit [Chthoniobacteraceae bacterium]|nr:multidrug efflux transporter permease subunit [Chthoniobacteraceae bacterium]
MNISDFFIRRPIFAAVLSIVTVIVGGIAVFTLPVAQYPDVTPPTVVVTAKYPGANPSVVAETVATPIEQQVNGVENMLYMSSQCTSDGTMTLTITFELGTNLNTAQVLVQNRVAIAEPQLPQDVRNLGVTTTKRQPALLMVVHMTSPDDSHDALYLNNYAFLQIRDALARLKGIGDVQILGAREYSMRVWLDPDKIANNNMTATDVVNALREQNVQVAAGTIGQPPVAKGAARFQLAINTLGRLTNEKQFEDIVIKEGENGGILRVRDVARVELAARDYSVDSNLTGKPAAAMLIFQLPGANALSVSDGVRAEMASLKKRFPPGVDFSIAYDPTVFVRESVAAVGHTLVEAIILVVLVVVVFLQSWRASIIPLLAVPVSLIGTFAVMAMMGFSLNNLSLFGLVLAIGIVVDDAIVVVENVERNIEHGLPPLEATFKAMREVSGPIIAVALVLCAVFVPTAFVSGITGQFYRQFALTIAVSTVLSAFNSLTLSPALAALLLRPRTDLADWFTRLLNFLFGWFFRAFNWTFDRVTAWYVRVLGGLIRLAAVAMIVYLGLIGLTWFGFKSVPVGFIPSQDQGYLIGFTRLPDGASLERTGEVVARACALARQVRGVRNTVEFPGFDPLNSINSPNVGAFFIGLDAFDKRTSSDLSGLAITKAVASKLASIQEGFVAVFPPPPVQGIGNAGGFKLMVQDRGNEGYAALQAAVGKLSAAANGSPELSNVFSSFRGSVPQLYVDVDRVKARSMGVPLGNVFETLQTYMGSLYVNDFNRFGRTYHVTAQADAKFRLRAEDIGRLKTRNKMGEMVPLSAVAKIDQSAGPDRVIRYNLYTAADLLGDVSPGVSSGEMVTQLEALADKTLPASFTTEWTELTLQQKLAGNTAAYIFPICVLFVFLTLAAQYESWSLPLAIILIVPMCLLSAIAGVWLRNMDNNIFTQIGLVVLVGLACKNAILIVEFAKEKQETGANHVQAAITAARLRLRPILMTSFAFILGVLPLVLAKGAGAEMRQALGTAVFFGMLGVTFFGLLLTPVFFVVIRRLTQRKTPALIPAALPVAEEAAPELVH